MENLITISNLNDFIFCPISIYFHNLDKDTEKLAIQSNSQLEGTYAHSAIDEKRYSSKKNILQAIPVYSEKYGIQGKIDLFDVELGRLTERKRKITTIYDGYIFQIYAQYFALKELGYDVREIQLYSMMDNIIHKIALPETDSNMLSKYEKVIQDIKSFNGDNFVQTNIKKCENCIYEELCHYSLLEEGKEYD